MKYVMIKMKSEKVETNGNPKQMQHTLYEIHVPSSSLRDIGAQSGLNRINIAKIPEFRSCGENSNHLDSFADFD